MQRQAKLALGAMVIIDALVVIVVFRSLLRHRAPMMKVAVPAVLLLAGSAAIVVFAFKKSSP
jgi:hypothetical protein